MPARGKCYPRVFPRLWQLQVLQTGGGGGYLWEGSDGGDATAQVLPGALLQPPEAAQQLQRAPGPRDSDRGRSQHQAQGPGQHSCLQRPQRTGRPGQGSSRSWELLSFPLVQLCCCQRGRFCLKKTQNKNILKCAGHSLGLQN